MSTLSASKQSIANIQTITGQLAAANLPPKAAALVTQLQQEAQSLGAMAAKMLEVGTDFIGDADKIVEGMEDAPKWIQELIKTGMRVLWRVSNLVQDYGGGVVISTADLGLNDMAIKGHIEITPREKNQ